MEESRVYDELRNLLLCELDNINRMGEINESQLMHVEKIVDAIKDIDEITAMNNGYSQQNMSYNNGNSYGRNNYRMYNRGNSYGYNSDYSRGSLLDHYQELMNHAQNDAERDMLRQMMNRLGN